MKCKPWHIESKTSILKINPQSKIEIIYKTKTLNFPATAKLKVLDLSSNNIRDIPNGVLQKMYKLETLNLENNPITFQQNQEYFKGLTNLKVRNPGEQPNHLPAEPLILQGSHQPQGKKT